MDSSDDLGGDNAPNISDENSSFPLCFFFFFFLFFSFLSFYLAFCVLALCVLSRRVGDWGELGGIVVGGTV